MNEVMRNLHMVCVQMNADCYQQQQYNSSPRGSWQIGIRLCPRGGVSA